MLPRVLETEAMDTEAEALDYDSMDHAAVNRAFTADLLQCSPGEGEMLDLGTGTALVPIELCRQSPSARVLAVDAAAHMLAVARRNVEAAGLDGRIRLERADAKELPYRDGQFQTVVSNSIVHHVADPRTVLREAWRVLAPGGLVFFRDLVRPPDDAAVRRLADAYAAGANAHQRQMFEDSLRASLTVEEVQDLVAELGVPRDTVRATSDRHWTWTTRKTLADSELTPDEAAEAKRYGRLDLYCALADKAIDLAFMAVMALVLARPIDEWLAGFGPLGNYWPLRLAGLLAVMMGLHVAVSLPLSVYSGFVLEHRFKLSKLTFPAWLWRYAKQMGLAAVFAVVLFSGLFWIIRLTGPWWWLAGAAASFLVSVVLGQLLPVVILPLFYKIEPLDRPDLAERLSGLAEGTGLSIAGVYRLDLSAETVKANAALAGLGRTRRVLLGDTLLESFSADEIETVFAHEIGHHVHRHVPKMLLAGIAYSAAGFWLCDRLLGWWTAGWGRAPDYAALPVWAVPFLALVLTGFTMAMTPLQNAVARHYERQADGYALRRTGNAAAFVSAFRKLARLNKDDPDPPALEVWLFHGHPPIRERVAMARRAATET